MAPLSALITKVSTLFALGPANLARVGLYRMGLRTGRHPVLKIKAAPVQGPVFGPAFGPPAAGTIAPENWHHTGLLFSYHPMQVGAAPPDWHANPFREGVRAEATKPWFQIPDFDPALGDIKTVWELSRFDWLITMAARAGKGDQGELARLNLWLEDWSAKNPPYLGANWKCGQEASIRVMHLCLAAQILGQHKTPSEALRALIRLHLARIAPTMGYAIGQANNHGTSEAAALFIGGLLLGPEGANFAKTGRKWLENRAAVLIEPDGTFSQYSTNYHRVMLDTYALAESWRRLFKAPAFSAKLQGRLRAASHWLYALTDPETGDAPNLGANDGARLLPLTDSTYRDFRPTVQLSCLLFAKARAYRSEGLWDQPALWLGIGPVPQILPTASQAESFDAGGLHVLRQGRARAYLRYPRFRFRPSQADALHLDLWLGPENLLRDGGSYSYATAEGAALGRVEAHNTVSFDGRDQMPKLGRFLYGDWLKTSGLVQATLGPEGATAMAAYRDRAGNSHQRHITLTPHGLRMVDHLSGPFREAVLRLRLAPGTWELAGQSLRRGDLQITFSGDTALQLGLTEGQESRHYLSLTPVPVLELRLDGPGQVITDICF